MGTVVPQTLREIASALNEAGFKAYLVGGCVRDLLLGRAPKDWDIATDATPEEIQKIFPESVYENQFGTVGVKTGSEEPTLRIVEVTTFRKEAGYSDKRHPDEVRFAKTVEEDLARRDFTINAIAADISELQTTNYQLQTALVDPYGGQKDIEEKLIRTVGKPEERFGEDALRLMRAARFATELEFEIESTTRYAIRTLATSLKDIAAERIRDELIKILMAPKAADGVVLLEELGLLEYIIPELREGIGVGQNKHHVYTIFEHNVRALDYSASKDYPLLIRVASLLHDVGKGRAKKGDGPDSTFYQHEYIGAKMTMKILERLRFPKDFTLRAAHLVRRHMFYYNVGDVSPAGVRRFLVRVGPDNIDDLLKVREADRIGSGVAKAVPYKLRHLLFMIEKVKRDPLSPKMLRISGEDVMRLAGLEPSPKIGYILSVLLESVLDDPERNTREYLEKRLMELARMPEEDLKNLAESAKKKKSELEEAEEEDIKKKFFVK